MAQQYAKDQFENSGFSERVEQIAQICIRAWGEPEGWNYADQDAALRVVDRIERFGALVPELMVRLWSMYGFAGFRDRSIWLCDPALPITKVIDTFLSDPDPEQHRNPDGSYIDTLDEVANRGWIPLLRDPYGSIIAYATLTGEYMLVEPADSRATLLNDAGRVDTDPDSILYNTLVLGPHTYGYFAIPDDATIEQCGPLTTDTFYNTCGDLLLKHLVLAPEVAHHTSTVPQVSTLDNGLLALAGLQAYITDYSRRHTTNTTDIVDVDVTSDAAGEYSEETSQGGVPYLRQTEEEFERDFPVYFQARYDQPVTIQA